MTKEDKSQAITILLLGVTLLAGVFMGGLLVKQDLKALQYQYEQLEEQYNQLTDRHWNLQQQLIRKEVEQND